MYSQYLHRMCFFSHLLLQCLTLALMPMETDSAWLPFWIQIIINFIKNSLFVEPAARNKNNYKYEFNEVENFVFFIVNTIVVFFSIIISISFHTLTINLTAVLTLSTQTHKHNRVFIESVFVDLTRYWDHIDSICISVLLESIALN